MLTDLFAGLSVLLAQLAPTVPTTAPVAEAPFWARVLANPLSMLVVGLVLMYFFVFRAKKKQEDQKKKLLDGVKKGDQIETIGGLLGTVVNADEKTVVIKVDENANVKLRFNRRAIHRVVVEEPAKGA